MHPKTFQNIVLLLFCVLFTSFVSEKKEIAIRIKPVFGEKALILEKEKYCTAQGDTVCIDLLRFYLSNLRIEFDNGKIYSEKNSFHLVEINNEQVYEIVFKNVPDRPMTHLKFYIGVDSLTSVSGALQGDLDPSKGMYWAWNSGYINAKMEGRSNSCKTRGHAFEFHIGGYLPPYPSLREVKLKLNGETNQIQLIADVETWFREINLQEQNSILIPGTQAAQMADHYKAMFKIETVQ